MDQSIWDSKMPYGNSSVSTYSTLQLCPHCGKMIDYQTEPGHISSATAHQEQAEAARMYSNSQWEAANQQQILARRIAYINEFGSLRVGNRKKKRKNMYDGNDERASEVWYHSNLFDNDEVCDGDCVKHLVYKCDECTRKGLEKMDNKTNNLPAIIASPGSYKETDKESAKQNFNDAIDFIKVGLKLNEKQIDDIKVKDLSSKVVEAQEKITVGQMKTLVGERIKSKGVIQTIGYKFMKWLGL